MKGNNFKKTKPFYRNEGVKLEEDEEERRKSRKKSLPTFLIWETRQQSVQAYMCITMNLMSTLQFCGALKIYGGVLWICFVTWAVVLGIPMITAEIAVGHYINNEIKYVWRMCRVGKGIFWNCLLATFVTAIVSQAYLACLLHLLVDPADLQLVPTDFNHGSCHNKSGNGICDLDKVKAGSKYFSEEELHRSIHYHKNVYELKAEFWVTSLYLAGICFMLILVNCKGIRSLEKVTLWFVILPYFFSVILAMLMFSVPGVVDYLRSCWRLDWYKLRYFSVWFESFKAMTKAFSIGSLGLIFVSVHSDYSDDIMVEVVILFLNTILHTLVHSIIILGLIGITFHESETFDLSINFQDSFSILRTSIDGLSAVPPPKWLWIFLFNTYVIISAFSELNILVASIADVVISLVPIFKTNAFYVIASVCIVLFSIGLGIFTIKNHQTPTLDLTFITIGFLQSITIFWIYNYERLSSDFHFLMGYRPSLFFRFTWAISPIIFLGLIITSWFQPIMDFLVNNNLYLSMLHLLIYILSAIIEVFILLVKKENPNIFRRDKSWGPSDPLLKQSRLIFKSRIITKEHIYRQKLYEERAAKPADITNQTIVQLF